MFLQDKIKIFDKEFELNKKYINRPRILTVDDGDLDIFQEGVLSKISADDFLKLYKYGEEIGLAYEEILDIMVEHHLIIRMTNEIVNV